MKPLKIQTENKPTGLRYNEGKLRYDLFEPHAMEELAKVFTKGAQKYAPRNWEKGMTWSSVLASLERHKEAFKKGEDNDQETGLLHMAHVAWNALALVSYYSIYPQGDDRPHAYLNNPRIGLDIDDVLADWVPNWCSYHGLPIATSWQFDRNITDKFESMRYFDTLDEFYLNLPLKTKPKDLPFEPACYVTSRPVSKEITEQWLDKNGFPTAPVYSVGCGMSKVQALKEAAIDIFVDDKYDNFVELNRAGICTYLFSAPHNERYSVGHKRINSLKELIK